MKHTVDTIKTINGNVDGDQMIASEFCQEVLEETKDRAKQIRTICDLSMILDTKTLIHATDALAGIRHLTASVESVAQFHCNGQLKDVFASLFSKLTDIREKAEGEYRWLSKLFPTNSTV